MPHRYINTVTRNKNLHKSLSDIHTYLINEQLIQTKYEWLWLVECVELQSVQSLICCLFVAIYNEKATDFHIGA